MHLLLLLLIAVLIGIVFTQANSRQEPTSKTSRRGQLSEPLAYLSRGKLFVLHSDGSIEQIHSPFIQRAIDQHERAEELHGWKQGTSFGTSFSSGSHRSFSGSDGTDLHFVAAHFVSATRIAYFIKGGNVGGMFEYDLVEKTETRVLHQQNLSLRSLRYDKDEDRFVCASAVAGGVSNITTIDRSSGDSTILTGGDTADGCPDWIVGKHGQLVMQSQGIGRNSDGHHLGLGPSSLELLDTNTNSMETVVEDERFDFIQPRVHPDGSLFYIRRPYEASSYKSQHLLIDIFAFPFRLASAIFHYLNFFSMMYSRKSLTSADGPQLKADRKQIQMAGRYIDTEKALRTHKNSDRSPSLVPASWQLISRNQFGQEQELAGNVLTFNISSAGAVYYTNGTTIYLLDAQGRRELIQDSLIEEIVVL